MNKIRGEYSIAFIDKLTDKFISDVIALGKEDRIRAEIGKVRSENHCVLFLEMFLAVKNILLEDAMSAIKMSKDVMEDEHILIEIYEEVSSMSGKIIAYHEGKSSSVAKLGGVGRAAKYDEDKVETIRLYKLGMAAGKWQTGRHHVPDAAFEITPQIVEFSRRKGRKGSLAPTTIKPKEWILEYRRHIKSNPS